jgi:hypothetical protein
VTPAEIRTLAKAQRPYIDKRERLDETSACNVDPEFCSQITAQVGSLLSNPNGGSWTAPVVIDEFGWPQGVSKTNNGQSIDTYEHGLELQNVVSYLNTEGVGWAAFAWDGTANQGPWQLISSTSTYAPNTDGTPIQNAMQGQYATCQDPSPRMSEGPTRSQTQQV